MVALFLAVYPIVNQQPKPTEALTNNEPVHAVVAEAPKKAEKPTTPPPVQPEPETKQAVQPAPPAVAVSANKQELMTAAGISPNDWPAVDYIVSHESSWRITAQNPSGAYGLCQALPASKMSSAGSDYLTNGVTQLRWCSSYAQARYGGWWPAYNAWTIKHWW